MQPIHNAIEARTNWKQLTPNNISSSIRMFEYNGNFLTSPTAEIASVDTAFILQKPKEETQQKCYLHVKSISGELELRELTMIASAPIMEVFIGCQREYLMTHYGIKIKNEDDTEDDVMPTSFRYDVDLKPGISEFQLRFFTPHEEICVFVLVIYGSQIRKDTPELNINNVLEMIGQPNENSLEKLEQYKFFMEKLNTMGNKSNDLPSKIEQPIELANDAKSFEQRLMKVIDSRLQKFEENILAKMDVIESRQNDVIRLLEDLTIVDSSSHSENDAIVNLQAPR